MILTKAERIELNKRATGRTIRAEEARRARCILMLAEGASWAQIRDKLNCNDSFVARWASASKPSGWRGCTVGTGAVSCARSRPNWRRAFWNAPGRVRAMDPRTGVLASWPRNWAHII